MRKYCIGALFGIVLILSTTAFADEGLKKIEAYLRPTLPITLDGKSVTLEAPPVVYDGSTYLKLRDIAKLTGLQVIWNDTTQTVELVSPKGTTGVIAPSAPPTPPIAKILKLHNDFSNKADGSVTGIDSGQTFGIFDNTRSASGLTVSGGKMVHGAPTGSNAAGYLEMKLDNKITHIGATFMFPSVANSGAVALASFANSIVEEKKAGKTIPSAGIHVTITTGYIEVIIYKASGSVNLGKITLTPALSANVAYSVDVVIEGQTLYVVLPDGTKSDIFTNPEIQSLSSNYATFELYELDKTKTPASILNVWAE